MLLNTESSLLLQIGAVGYGVSPRSTQRTHDAIIMSLLRQNDVVLM